MAGHTVVVWYVFIGVMLLAAILVGKKAVKGERNEAKYAAMAIALVLVSAIILFAYAIPFTVDVANHRIVQAEGMLECRSTSKRPTDSGISSVILTTDTGELHLSTVPFSFFQSGTYEDVIAYYTANTGWLLYVEIIDKH